MKILRKPIEVIACFDMEGNPAPVRFRYFDDAEGITVIKIDKIMRKDLDKFAGNKMIKYTCESHIRGEIRPYEIRYELESCKWFLYKI